MKSVHQTRERGAHGLVAWVLALSVAANLGMAAALERRAQGAAARAMAQATMPTRPVNPLWQAPRRPSQSKADLGRFAGIWGRLVSPDYATLIENLRAVGCPEPAVRNIVIPRIDADFEKRKKNELPKPEYWRTASQFAAMRRRILPRLAALEDQKHRKIQSFWAGESCRRWQWLSIDLSFAFMVRDPSDAPVDGPRSLGFRLASLSPELKWSQARPIKAGFLGLIEQAGALQGANAGFVLVEDLDRMRKDLVIFQQSLPAGFSAELAARSQKPRLEGVDLSEQELRELCRLRSLQPAWAGSIFYEEVPILKMAAQKEENAAGDLPETLIRELLGPDRYAAYQRAQDGDFQTIWKLAQAAKLPKDAAAQAFDQINSTRLGLEALASDTSLAGEQKQAALAELARSTTEKLKSVLGEKGCQTLAANGMLKFLSQVHGPAPK